MKHLKTFDYINESKRSDDVLKELESDTTEYAAETPIESVKDHVSNLLWNLFVSKKYLHRLNGNDVKEIINTLINRVVDSENESDDTKLDSRINKNIIKNTTKSKLNYEKDKEWDNEVLEKLIKKLEELYKGNDEFILKRSEEIMEIHHTYLNTVRWNKSPESVSDILYKYKKDLRK